MRRPHRLGTAFSPVEILILVAFLAILAATVVPQLCQAGPDAKPSALTTAMQTVRGQLALYRQQHNGQYPDAAKFTEQMTRYTDPQGASSPLQTQRCRLGPYLSDVPVNPFTGTNEVSAAGSSPGAAWCYDETTGEFRAGHCPEQARY